MGRGPGHGGDVGPLGSHRHVVVGAIGRWSTASGRLGLRALLLEDVVRQNHENRSDLTSQLRVDPAGDRLDLGGCELAWELGHGLHVVEQHDPGVRGRCSGSDLDHRPRLIADDLDP